MGNPFRNVTEFVERTKKKLEDEARRAAGGRQPNNQPVSPGMPPKVTPPTMPSMPQYVGNGRVPMTIKYGSAPTTGTVMKNFSAKSPAPYWAPRDVNGQPVKQLKAFGEMEPLTNRLHGKEILPGGVMPKFTGQPWQLPVYGVKSPQDYRDKILSGSAFGAKPTGASQSPNTLPVMIEDEYGNLTYAQQNTPLPVEATTAQRIAWGNAIDYEDASDRARKRAGQESRRDLIGLTTDIAQRVAGVASPDYSYDPIENIRANRGTPSVNTQEAPSLMPAYTGSTGSGYSDWYGGWGGGGGGGGGGSYSPPTKRWLNSMATWRV